MCRTLVLVSSLWFFSAPVCLADWSLNIGYQNPANARFGLNFLYEGSQWGFEAGVGYIDIDVDSDADQSGTSKNNDADFRVGGEIDIRYFLGGKSFRPYLKVGFGVGVAGRVDDDEEDADDGAGISAGGPYAGIGVKAGKAVYLYASINTGRSADPFVQAGIGVDI